MSRKYLVTGAAGFIGSHLVDRLLADGHDVVGVDNFFENYDASVKRDNLRDALSDRRFQLIEADIRHRARTDDIVGRFGPDVIVHMAALAGVRPSIRQPSLYVDVNVGGTTCMLDAAISHRVGHFVLASSSSVYGNSSTVPFREDDPAAAPISPYAASKRAAELLAHTYHHVHGMPITCLRFFTVYGPRQRPDLAIHQFMRQIHQGQKITLFGDGSTSRDYTYIGDIIDGVVRAAERPAGFRIANLGSSHPVSLKELVRAVESAVGRSAIIDRQPTQAGDVDRTFADVTLAHRWFDYQPQVALADGLAVQWQLLKPRLDIEAQASGQAGQAVTKSA